MPRLPHDETLRGARHCRGCRISSPQVAAGASSEKPRVPYSYGAAVFCLRLPPEAALSDWTVSVLSTPVENTSRAKIRDGAFSISLWAQFGGLARIMDWRRVVDGRLGDESGAVLPIRIVEGRAMDEKELAKQVYTYADAITVFAFAQGIAFGFVVGQNSTLACNIAAYWFFAAPIMAIMACAFLFMVRRCHRAEDHLIGVPATRSEKIAAIVPGVRTARLWIICLMGIAEVLLTFGVAFYPPRAHCL